MTCKNIEEGWQAGRKFRGTRAGSFVLSIPPQILSQKVNFLNSMIRSSHLREIGRFATYESKNIQIYIYIWKREHNIRTIISIVVESINTIIFSVLFIYLVSLFHIYLLRISYLISP